MDNMFEREYWEQKHREAYPEQYAAPPYLGGGPVNAPMMPPQKMMPPLMPPQMMPNAPMPPVQSPPPRHWLGSEGIGNMEVDGSVDGDSLPIPRDFAPTQLPEMGGPKIWAPLERPQLTPEEMMRLRQMLLEQRSRGLLGE